MSVTTYPGIYIEEDSTTTLSISQQATAVPAFIMVDNDSMTVNQTHEILRINSWLDYVTKAYELESSDYVMDFSNIRDVALRAYFENGGGYCYLVSPDFAAASIPLYPDITLVVAAGQNGYFYDTNWINGNNFCQPGSGLFGIVDGPGSKIDSSYDPSTNYSENSCITTYYPWFTASWAKTDIPPSAVMAGIYCSIDRTQGVWHAPANVTLQGGLKPKYKVTDDLQGHFNQGLAINMIRTLDNRGPVVWGARTLEDSDNWRYISVRRLFISIERDITTTMQSMLFETNTPVTWEKVRTTITNYLYKLWQQGALMGATASEAYFVQIGEGVTMSADDIDQGKMIIKVGVAATRPAEFIILQFSQQTSN